ncbi:hypothetical protein HID58_036612 [Brassica napus]|uniref:RING-type E3 ubiquitin transferase n=1 Tax=Brassica napus TaxID=3708 RepID=A0ABQ8C886_BRANA|nr:hypothetical protein HID58_036612 [Brassica napus]
MSTETTTNSSSFDPAPLLSSGDENEGRSNNGGERRSARRQGLREAAMFLSRASSGGRAMREPSMLVREAAAEQLEERQSDWAYSKPVVVLDIVWNLAFVSVAAGVLVMSRNENPIMPLRCGKTSGICQHHVFVYLVDHWVLLGICWWPRVSTRIPTDLLVVYCLPWFRCVLRCLLCCVGLRYWHCCLLLPAMHHCSFIRCCRSGASKEDIEQLTKFKFRKVGDVNKHAGDEAQGNTDGIMIECGTDSPVEHTLLQEDAECCICLSAYEDGTELRELPCGHHFHCSCVDKWLYINATCPLCKHNILKSSNLDREEV